MYKVKGYGWKKSKEDKRDLRYMVPAHIARSALSLLVDLRTSGFMPSPYDQSNLGSCTGNAIAGHLHYNKLKEGMQNVQVPSRLFIYMCERILENTFHSDEGAEIRDGFKAINQWGFCGEDVWPYDISKFNVSPPSSVWGLAWHERVASTQYFAVSQTQSDICGCLASGYPVVIGFSVYESFESEQVAQTGVVPMPKPSEQILGGHAVLIVGYDLSRGVFIVRNSWGTGWGDGGYFYMPLQYFLDPTLASDLWTARLVK